MNNQVFIGIGGILASATSISIYNNYISHVNRHDEMINKIDGFDNRLTKIETKIEDGVDKRMNRFLLP